MLRITKLFFALILYTLPAFAQEGECVSRDVIVPESYKDYLFQSISLDSVAAIAASEQTTPLTYDLGEGEIVDAYKYIQNEQEYIAIKRGRGWLSALMDIYSYRLFGSGNEYELVDFDGTGSRELLIHHCENNSRGGMYGSHDVSYCSYTLIDVNKGLVYHLGEDYTEEYSNYTGYRADDYEDSLQEEREMTELDDEENWEFTHNECNFNIIVKPGKVIYESISCSEIHDCPDSDTVTYLLQKDNKLLREHTPEQLHK